MANVNWRFHCPPSSGDLLNAYTVPTAEMGEYPYRENIMLNRDTMRSQSGKLWSYKNYQIQHRSLRFVEVSNDFVGTLKLLATSGTEFLFIDDVYNSGGTGTYFFTEDTFVAEEVQHNLWNVEINMQEIEDSS